MSSLNEAERVSLLQESFVSNCAQFAAAAMLLYEYVLTLDQEVEIIRGRRNASFFVFVLNRLVMISLVIINVLEAVPWTSNVSCQVIGVIFDVLQLLTYAIWAAISALRTWVIWKGSWLLPAFVFALSLVPFASNMYSSVMVSYITATIGPPPAGTFCDPIVRFSTALDNRALIASRTCAMAADVLVLLATWHHTILPNITWRQAVQLQAGTPLLTMLLREGALYFIVLLLITVAQIVINEVEALSIGTVFLVPALSILISRFLLDMRHAVDKTGAIWESARDMSATYTMSSGADLSFGRDAASSLNTETVQEFSSHTLLQLPEWGPNANDIELAQCDT